MPRQPRIGSSRLQEGGLLATHKADFLSHVEGGGFRHTADHIDMNPSLSQFNAPDVQGTLELIAGFAASAGSGFVSVGNQTADGYATGSYNVTNSLNFRQALLAAFSDTRLQNGGYVLILNGTYKLNTTVDVPSGITIIGEPSGSIIVGETSDVPMFNFKAGVSFPLIGGDQGAGPIELSQGTPADSSGLRTLILADNLDGYSSGQPTLPSSSMVQIETGASVKVADVKFLGRVADGLLNPASGRDKTLRAIETVSENPTATSLEVSGCFFDGISQPIRFTPNSGNIDRLVIKNNRARVFGLENSSDQTDANNSFCALSLCDLTAVNNFIVTSGSSGDFVTSCFTVVSNGSGSTDVSMLISNTTGRSSASVLTSTSVFSDSVGTASYKVVQDNNNWGSDVNNSWYVIVGDGGDFQGPGALDLVFNSSFNYPTDIYILPGTYTVTANGSSSYNLIGLDSSITTYPKIILNLTSAPTDEVGNDILNCGQMVKNLSFEVNAGWHSIRPGGDLGGAKRTEVKNCTFTNVGISVNNSIDADLTNKVEIDNCYFLQDGDYDDNINILLPSVENVIVKNSTFTGYGYVGLIGNDSSLSYTTSSEADILVQGCVFDQTDYTIDDASPLTVEAFLSIQNANGKVTLKNNKVIVASGNQIAAIASDTRASNDFESYININANIIQLENNDFNCAYRTYDVSASDYILPGLLLSPLSSVRIENSYFYNCLCQISGASTLDARGDGIYINNNFFIVDDTDYSATTVLDIDIDPAADTPSARKVLIDNNSFYVKPSQAGDPPLHAYHAVSGTYTTLGVVQVFADDIPVYFRGNLMDATLPSLVSDTVVSGLIVNNKSVGNATLPACQITDNDLYVINNFTSGDNTEVASAVYVDCTNLQVFGNELAMDNSAGVGGSNQICCLYVLTNQNVAGEDPVKALVKGNNFSRREKSSGTAVSLTSFVRIDGASEPGVATDNVFSDDTVDGTDELVFNDDSSSWASYNNINEIYTIQTSGEMGVYGVSANASNDSWNPIIGDNNGPGISSYIIVDLNNPSDRVTFAYDSSDSLIVFQWYVSLNGIVPWGASIVEASVDIDATSNPATSDDVYLRIAAGGGLASDLSNITTAGDTLTITSSSLRVSSGSDNHVSLQAFIENGSNVNITTTGPLNIKYKL